MFAKLTVLLRTLVLAGILAIGGWWTLFLRERFADHRAELESAQARIGELAWDLETKEARVRELTAENGELRNEVERQAEEIDSLNVAMTLLKVDHRIARLQVLSQEPDPEDPSEVRTRLRFVELDAEGNPVGPGIETEVSGKTVYVETLVVKFDDDYVEAGDALRGTSICLFRRLFGEDQKPTEGTELDPAGLQPLAYTDDEGPNPLHREIWNRFWELANDPALARERGVRALHGEAPFIETRPGKTYRVELRSSGGLTIQAER